MNSKKKLKMEQALNTQGRRNFAQKKIVEELVMQSLFWKSRLETGKRISIK